MGRRPQLFPCVVFTVLAVVATCPVLAQELEPRAYRALPTELNFFVVAYSFSSGNVVVDPSVPLENLEAEIHSAALAYLRTFGLFGRSASIAVSAPYVYVSASAKLEGELVEGSRADWADARVQMAVNLLGGPAQSLSEFAGFRQRRTLGVGLTVGMPTGQYSSSKLINFGANRWGFKPEIGYSSTRGRWIFEFAVGAWLFTANKDGFGGTTKRQDPIWSTQGHLSYNFPGGVWVGLDANYFGGGRTSVDGVDQNDLQENSRLGLTLSIPLKQQHSVKLAVHSGAITRVGADFDIATIAYSYRWGGGS